MNNWIASSKTPRKDEGTFKKQVEVTIIVLGFLLLTSCAVGPDYVPPTALDIDTYTESPTLNITADSNQAIDAQWWRIYQNEALNDLVSQALKCSPTVKSAASTLQAAQELYQAAYGYYMFPRIDANASVTRQQVNLKAIGFERLPDPPPFTLYTLGTTLSYNLDLFGGNRRKLEMMGALIDYERYALIASQVSLATNVVSTVIKMASLTEQRDITHDVLSMQQTQYGIMEKQFRTGSISEHDLIQKRLQINDTKAQLMPLEKQLAQTRHQLAIYLGKTPSTASIPCIRLADLALPPLLPLSIPSDLLQQRPDIQEANALMHQSSALIGVATAAMFPKINITGSLATEAFTVGNLFGPGSGAWAIGPQLMQPIFHGGQLRAQKRAAQAAYEEAQANYQNTVIQAIQNVADTLKAIEFDGHAFEARCEATAQAEKDYHIAQRQFEIGSKSQFNLLDVQQAYYQKRLAQAPVLADRLSDTAALYQALGGGWWNAAPCEDDSAAATVPSLVSGIPTAGTTVAATSVISSEATDPAISDVAATSVISAEAIDAATSLTTAAILSASD